MSRNERATPPPPRLPSSPRRTQSAERIVGRLVFDSPVGTISQMSRVEGETGKRTTAGIDRNEQHAARAGHMPATTHLCDLLTIVFIRKLVGDYSLNELRSVFCCVETGRCSRAGARASPVLSFAQHLRTKCWVMCPIPYTPEPRPCATRDGWRLCSPFGPLVTDHSSSR